MLYFIVNKTSRTGKSAQIWESVRKILDARDIEYMYHITMYEGHATELAREISAKNEEDITIVVLGGDGTMNEVLNGIVDFEKVRFGIIPTGSGNDFGGGLNFPSDPVQNLNTILHNYQLGKEHFTRMDIGKVEWKNCPRPRYFGISSGLGMDATVCKKALTSKLKKVLNKIHLGKLTYILLTIHTLFSMETANAEITYTDLSGEQKSATMNKLIFSAAMNLRAEGGGVPMAPKAKGTDHMLSLSSAYGIPKWRTFLCLPILVMAKHEHLKGFDVFGFTEAKVQLSKEMVLHADGEYLGDVKEAIFTSMPNTLKLLNKISD